MTWPVRIEIPRQTPSGNDFRGGGKKWSNHHDYTRLRQTWEAELSATVGGAPALRRIRVAVQAAGKMRMEITCRRKRLLDPNNLHAGLKPVIDAAKNVGLILDDSADLLEYEARQERSGRMRPVTIFELQAVKDD